MKKRIFCFLILIVFTGIQLGAQCTVQFRASSSRTWVTLGEIFYVYGHLSTYASLARLDKREILNMSEGSDVPLFKILSRSSNRIELQAIKQGSASIEMTATAEVRCMNGDKLLYTRMTEFKDKIDKIIVRDPKMPRPLCGDVNSDGRANIVDALLIASYDVGLISKLHDSRVGDVNSDGAINIVDSLSIARHYVGIGYYLNCPEIIIEFVKVIHRSGIQCEKPFLKNINEAKATLESNGIKVHAISIESVAVDGACGLSDGITYIATINSEDYDKAMYLGWSPLKE